MNNINLGFNPTLMSNSIHISEADTAGIIYITNNGDKENYINHLMVTNDKYYNFLKLKFITDCMEGSNYE